MLERLVEQVLGLEEILLLAHGDIPIGLGQHAWLKPYQIQVVETTVDWLSFLDGEWAKQIRREVVRLQVFKSVGWIKFHADLRWSELFLIVLVL